MIRDDEGTPSWSRYDLAVVAVAVLTTIGAAVLLGMVVASK